MGRVAGGVRKQADVDKHRERVAAERAKQMGKEQADEVNTLYGPVDDKELLAARGAARVWLHVVRPCQKLVASFMFQMVITVVILITAISIGFSTMPTANLYEDQLGVLEWVVTSIFVAEILLKMIAKKWRPLYFFVDKEEWTWNNFDFWIVAAGFLPGLGSQVQLLRLLRLLRILKLLKMVVELQMILRGLAAGIASVGYVFALMGLIFYLYGCIGFILFRSEDPLHFDTIIEAFIFTLFRASTLEDWTDLFYASYYGCESYGYDPPRADDICYRYGTALDTIILSVPEPCNMSYGYSCYDPVHNLAFNSSRSGGEAYGDPDHPSRWVFQAIVYCYWVLFIFIGSFVLLSLFIGAITIGMQGSIDDAKEQRESALREKKDQRRQLKHAQIVESGMDEIMDAWHGKRAGIEATKRQEAVTVEGATEMPAVKRWYISLAGRARYLSLKPAFNHFITLIILLASAMVGLESDDIVWTALNQCPQVPCETEEMVVTNAIDMIILLLFTLECIVKIVAEGLAPWRYLFTGCPPTFNYWNLFDFSIVAAGYLPGEGSILMVLRLLRLLRVLKLVRALPELQIIVSALLSGLASITYVSMLLVLIYYLYAIVGCICFSANDPWHFRDVVNAMLTLVRASTFEDWTDVMYINMYGCDKHAFYQSGTPALMCDNAALGYTKGQMPVLSGIYFISFILLAALVMMSLFIGVVTTSMETETNKNTVEKQRLKEVASIQKEYAVDDQRLADYQNIFNAVVLEGEDRITDKDLKFLLKLLSPTINALQLEERIDVVLGDKDAADLSFTEVFKVLVQLDEDMQVESDEQQAIADGGTEPEETSTLASGGPGHANSSADCTDTTVATPGGSRVQFGGVLLAAKAAASMESHAQTHHKGSLSSAHGNTELDEHGRLILPGLQLQKSVASKVRRLLEHSNAFDIPEDVRLGGNGVSQLVMYADTMRQHAKRVVDASESSIAADELDGGNPEGARAESMASSLDESSAATRSSSDAELPPIDSGNIAKDMITMFKELDVLLQNGLQFSAPLKS